MVERFRPENVDRLRENEKSRKTRMATAEIKVLEHFDSPHVNSKGIAGMFGALALITLLSGLPKQAQAQDIEEATRVTYEIYKDVDRDVENHQENRLDQLTHQLEALTLEIAETRSHYDEQIDDASMTEGSLDQKLTDLRTEAPYDDADINKDEIAKLEGKKGAASDLSPDERKGKTEKLQAEREEKLAPLLADKKDLEKKINIVENEQKAFKAFGRGLRTALNIARDVKQSQQRTERNR